MYIKTPPLGWNSWNTFGEKIDENLIKEMADAMVSTGLRDAGYEYLVIDDCWSEKERDKNGRLVADHNKFPNGMAAVADYVHSKGLKFGMYSCAGVMTCAGYPSSFNHEYEDAKTFAGWGVDFLKYDYCFRPDTTNGEMLYRRMAMALKASGREILFSACSWGSDDCWEFMRSAGADMYRSTGDISDNYESFKNIAVSQFKHLNCNGPSCYNDIDMLIVGMGGKGNVAFGGCTDEEYKTHFALWCMYGTPLMIGCDIRSMSENTAALLKNEMLLSINQDIECRPPYLIGSNVNFGMNGLEGNGVACMFKHLANGEYALGMFNLSDSKRGYICMLEDAGLPLQSGLALELTDVFTGETIGKFDETVRGSLEPHACNLYKCKVVEK